MRKTRALVFATLLLVAPSSCTRLDGQFACGSSTQCTLGEVGGTCEATGFCSFPSSDCSSGRRYGEYSSPGLSGECVSTTNAVLNALCGDGNVAPGEECDDGNRNDGDGCSSSCVAQRYASCKDAHTLRPTAPSGVYYLKPASTEYRAYCEMEGDGGGWTLVLKVDGRNTTFDYNVNIWSTSTLLNESSIEMDQTEAKLAPYKDLAFTQLRVGMVPFGRPASQARWIVGDVSGRALIAVLSQSTAVPFQPQLGRSAWLGLIDEAALQPNCNQEALNNDTPGSQVSVRIGILGNNENDCASPDSFIGIGGNRNGVRAGVWTTGNGGFNSMISQFGYVMIR